MLRVIPLMLWVILAIDYCLGEQTIINFPKDKGTGLRKALNECAQNVNADLDEIMAEIYAWDIKSEEKVKDFLHCFYERRDENNAKFDPKNLLIVIDDKDKKDAVAKILQDCGAKSTGSDAKEKLYAFVGCFVRESPILIKI